eukprot:scaffold159588_cov26-Tisochrysis_lutea.AAC.4
MHAGWCAVRRYKTGRIARATRAGGPRCKRDELEQDIVRGFRVPILLHDGRPATCTKGAALADGMRGHPIHSKALRRLPERRLLSARQRGRGVRRRRAHLGEQFSNRSCKSFSSHQLHVCLGLGARAWRVGADA